MRNVTSSKIASIIAIVISVALLLFLFIFPSLYTKRVASEIIKEANLALEITKTDHDINTLRTHLDSIKSILDTSAVTLRLFHPHADIAALQNSVARCHRILELKEIDASLTMASLCDILENAKHISEREQASFDAFI